MGERLTRRPRVAKRPVAACLALAALALAGCGDGERQDAGEPEGEFPVEITTAKFPSEQRLGETTDFVLEVENVGEETIPNLAVTINLDEGNADSSFSIRDDQPGLANPNRPVWILESKYPQIAGEPRPLGLSGGETAQTNTFAFGSLEAGESREMIWRVTAVRAGTHTVNYIVSAGLFGKAVAVTDGGGEPSGEIVATVTDEPPKTRVNGKGDVVLED